MATCALEALEETLGANSPVAVGIRAELFKAEENSTTGVFYPHRPQNPSQDWIDQQHAPLRIGALKALAAPFYKHLSTVDPEWVEAQLFANGLYEIRDYVRDSAGIFYPWNPEDDQVSEKNQSVATIGQLKLVFSLRFDEMAAVADPDADGLTTAQERDLGTNPLVGDTDNDGMPDGYELQWGFDPLSSGDAQGDFDGDMVSNLREFQIGSTPTGLYRVESVPLSNTTDAQLADVGADGSFTIVSDGLVVDLDGNPQGTGAVAKWVGPSLASGPRMERDLPVGAWSHPYNEGLTSYFYAGEGKFNVYHRHLDTTSTPEVDEFSVVSDDPAAETTVITSWSSIAASLFANGYTDTLMSDSPEVQMVSPSGNHFQIASEPEDLILTAAGDPVGDLPDSDVTLGFTSIHWLQLNDVGEAIGYGMPGKVPVFWAGYFQSVQEVQPCPLPADWDSDDWTLRSRLNIDGKAIIEREGGELYVLDAANGTVASTGFKPGTYSAPVIRDVNPMGYVVGTGPEAWLYNDGVTMKISTLKLHGGSPGQKISDLGWSGFAPVAVSDNGTITGTATLPAGGGRAVVQIIPVRDADGDGIEDDWEQHFAAHYLEAVGVNPDDAAQVEAFLSSPPQHLSPSMAQSLASGDLNSQGDYTGENFSLEEIRNSLSGPSGVEPKFHDELDTPFTWISQTRQMIQTMFIWADETNAQSRGAYQMTAGARAVDPEDGWLDERNEYEPDFLNDYLDANLPWLDSDPKTEQSYQPWVSSDTYDPSRSMEDRPPGSPPPSQDFEWYGVDTTQARVKLKLREVATKDMTFKVLLVSRKRETLYDYIPRPAWQTTPSAPDWEGHKVEEKTVTVSAGHRASEWLEVIPEIIPGMQVEVKVASFRVNSMDKYLAGNIPETLLQDLAPEGDHVGIYFERKQSGGSGAAETYSFENLADAHVYDKGMSEDTLVDDPILSEAEVAMTADTPTAPQVSQPVVFYRKNGCLNFRALFNEPGKIEIGLLYNGARMESLATSGSNGDPPEEGASTAQGVSWTLVANDDVGKLIDKVDAILSNTWQDHRGEFEMTALVATQADEAAIEAHKQELDEGRPPGQHVVGDPLAPRLTTYARRNQTIKVMMPVWQHTDRCFINGAVVSNTDSGYEELIQVLKVVGATSKGFVEGMWGGLKSDVEGIAGAASNLYKLITNPGEMARSFKESFKALLDLSWEDWKKIPALMANAMFEEAEKSIPWEGPSAFDLAAYLAGYGGGYITEQIAMSFAASMLVGAAIAGKFGTKIAEIVRLAREGLRKIEQAKKIALDATLGPALKAAKAAKGAMFRWLSQFVKDLDGVRYLRKVQDFSFRKYVGMCDGVFKIEIPTTNN